MQQDLSGQAPPSSVVVAGGSGVLGNKALNYGHQTHIHTPNTPITERYVLWAVSRSCECLPFAKTHTRHNIHLMIPNLILYIYNYIKKLALTYITLKNYNFFEISQVAGDRHTYVPIYNKLLFVISNQSFLLYGNDNKGTTI